jgi:hypothetical protein
VTAIPVTLGRGHRSPRVHPFTPEVPVSPRSSAVVALVASLTLVVVAAVSFAAARTSGVGENLEQVRVAADSSLAEPSPRADAEPPAPRTGKQVRVVDATRIERPRPPRPPQSVQVAGVGLTMPVKATGVAQDGQMALPADPRIMGWYRFGPEPGDRRGSTVLAGHVDSREYGTGPLVRLASVQPGTEVVVTAADGTPLRYRVTTVERITQAALPVDRLFDPTGPHRLTLVTCGGRYLPEAGGYEDNILVTATPIGRSR